MESILAWVDRIAAGLLLPLSVWILISGVDDLFLFFVFVWARLTNRLPKPPASVLAARPPDGPERRIAIFVALWRESAVIATMLQHNLAAIRYTNYDFFVGVYPNDPATENEVRRVAARHANVHLALGPHDGPTSKGDCLNWVYRAMLAFEQEQGARFDLALVHDAEDLLHPAELTLANWCVAAGYDMSQIPVLPLPTPWREFTHGTYCDDFAEFHTKDLPARSALGGFVPSSGVSTVFSRRALDAMASYGDGVVFRPDALTEDYETGYRLHRLGLRQAFIPILRPPSAQPLAARSFFPQEFAKARRQRTRWITGIALQGWQRNGWGANWRESYWFFRDRKGLIGNPASLLANLICIYGFAGLAASCALGYEWGLAGRTPNLAAALLPATLAVGLCLVTIRTACSASVYGWRFAAWVAPRAWFGAFLNTCAAVSALRQFLRSRWSGKPLAWLKTDHAYPNLAALNIYKPAPDAAANGGSEQDALVAQMSRHSLSGGYVPPDGVPAAALRLLPATTAATAKVVPIRLRNGIVMLACRELPDAASIDRLRGQLRLPVEFHMVTGRNFFELASRLQGSG